MIVLEALCNVARETGRTLKQFLVGYLDQVTAAKARNIISQLGSGFREDMPVEDVRDSAA